MCIVSCIVNLIKYRLLCPKYHIGALLGLLYVDAVHHEGLIDTCPFDIWSATATKDFRT